MSILDTISDTCTFHFFKWFERFGRLLSAERLNMLPYSRTRDYLTNRQIPYQNQSVDDQPGFNLWWSVSEHGKVFFGKEILIIRARIISLELLKTCSARDNA